MRIKRLDLFRFGRFTDTSIVLPAGNADFHILFGPNEAGKSTALTAIENLLFGIPGNSPYNFLHDYQNMKIGAVLQNDGKTLEVRRRKGNKDTLLNASDVPIAGGASALAPLLGGADQAFFARMFSLDHERLRRGGREILEAQDEIGQMLFSAGAGLTGLRDRLRAFNEEADGLWAPRRAGHRKYYQAVDRLEIADRALREHTVTATKWQELKRAYDEAQEAYDSLEKQNEEFLREQRKLSRIRRVYRDVRKLAELDEDLAGLAGITRLPEEARTSLEASERDQLGATTRVATLREQLDSEQAARGGLECNEEILLREDDILQFRKRRIEVQKEKTDLPHRVAELVSAEASLRRLAEELDWSADDIAVLVARIPSRAKVSVLRTLISSHGERASAIENAKAASRELEGQITDVQQELDELGAPVDVSRLAAITKALRESVDMDSRTRAAESEIREAKAAIERRLKSLKPPVLDEQALVSTPVPAREAVQNHRDARRQSEQRSQACQERIRSTEQELARHRMAHERLAHDEDAVAPNEVGDARLLRNSGWSLIRRRYIDGSAVSPDEIHSFAGGGTDLARAYETSVAAADNLADRRFDNAQAAAQIAVTCRQIAEQQELLEVLRHEEAALAGDERALGAAWNEMWAGASFQPLSPDLMLEWLSARTEILKDIDRRDKAQRQLDALRDEEMGTKARILAELASISSAHDDLRDQPLRVVLEAAAAVQNQDEKEAAGRRQTEQQLRKMRADAVRKRLAVETADTAWGGWETAWSAAAQSLGLSADIQPQAAVLQLDAIDQMREIAVQISQLRTERIGKIERDIENFARDVATLVAAVPSDLANASPEEAILELERRLEAAKRINEQLKSKDAAIFALQKKIDEYEESGRLARETIEGLQQAAGASDIDQLKAAIRNSDTVRALERERGQLIDTLAKQGDGLSLAELNKECEAVDIDGISAREQTLEQDLKDLRGRLTVAAEIRTQTRSAFDAIGGDDLAAEAAAGRQAALVEIRDVAERFVRVRSAATILEWAIERYRREKQAPLLKRAGQVFATLTSGSFNDLRVEFDENDKAQLAGLRPSGELVRVGGMSTGTADQLYLALRVASVEDYLDRATALPFVADDLFINFDNARAAAGFEVLGQLALRTQVLFFTHHSHLVDIARQTLGKAANVVSLLKEPLASAA